MSVAGGAPPPWSAPVARPAAPAWTTGFGPPPPSSPRRLGLVLVCLAALAVLAVIGLVLTWFLARPTAAPYQNEDYRPPPVVGQPDPVPRPATVDQARQWTTANTVYRSTVPLPVRCEVARVLPGSIDQAALQAHLDAMILCLLRDWDPPIREAGFTLVHPVVNVYRNRVETPCGTKSQNAGYCSANQQFYFDITLPGVVAGIGDNPWAEEVIVAHEFGHFIQGRTGIYASTYGLEDRRSDEAAALALNRRLENQADCFSGLFLRSVSRSIGLRQADLGRVLDVYVRVGADTLSGNPAIESDHGRAASRVYWGRLGLSGSDVGRCNTYVASADLNR